MSPERDARTEPVVIDMAGVAFAYDGREVLGDVNLQIRHCELIAVIGPNGGGKTTLLLLILGLLRPNRGRITVLGGSPAEVSRRIGYVPQHLQFDPNFPVTVGDVVLMGRAGRSRLGFYSRLDREAAREALAVVDLAAMDGRPFSRLSGGQRQRVLIARALAGSPELLLFDEPTANVDSHAGEALHEVLFQLSQRMAVLVVSHDIGFVAKQISSVVCVNHEVKVHPVSELAGRNIIDLYGRDMSLIRHDHRCSEEGHQCSNS